MSKKRAIQRLVTVRDAQAQAAAPTRAAFSIVIAFDPAHPQSANVNVMPVGGNSVVHIDDVVTALRLGYEQVVMEKGARLLKQQLTAQNQQAQETKE
jgi:hypothetical protein